MDIYGALTRPSFAKTKIDNNFEVDKGKREKVPTRTA